MNDFDITLSLNSKQIPAKVHQFTEGESTYYDVNFEDQTLSLHKDTLYTWVAENNNGLSQADIQSIGEQLLNY